MPKFIDRTGQRYGRWTVLERAPNHGRKTMWYCRCDCGTEKAVSSTSLAEGTSVSCGCYQKERARDIATTIFPKVCVKNLVG